MGYLQGLHKNLAKDKRKYNLLEERNLCGKRNEITNTKLHYKIKSSLRKILSCSIC
jgi:hypothetical protein